jgi:hypothetical protein
MVAPLVVAGLVAAAAAISTMGGVAVANWTDTPEMETHVNAPIDTYTTGTQGTGGINIDKNVILIGAAALAVVLLTKKK